MSDHKILDYLDPAALIGFLQQMIACNSENPPGREEAVARLIAAKLEQLGLEVELQEVEPGRPNVIALLPGASAECLLFNGHMDTVAIGTMENWHYDPLAAEICDGNMYGRGTADMKSGLAAMIFAIEALVKSGVVRKKSILFTGVIDEEVYFKGTQALIDAGKLQHCSRAYISEPTGLGVATSLQGAAEFAAEVYGKSSHSGMPELGENAIFYMNHLLNALQDYRASLKGKGRKLGFPIDPALSVGIIEGGSGILFVPDHCRIEFDRQVLPGEDMQQVIQEIEQLFAATCAKHGFTGKLRCNQYFASWQVDHASAAAQELRHCHEAVTGSAVQDILFRAYCEIEMLAGVGIPGAVYGPGNILQAHRPDEYVALKEVETAAKTYCLLAERFVTED